MQFPANQSRSMLFKTAVVGGAALCLFSITKPAFAGTQGIKDFAERAFTRTEITPVKLTNIVEKLETIKIADSGKVEKIKDGVLVELATEKEETNEVDEAYMKVRNLIVREGMRFLDAHGEPLLFPLVLLAMAAVELGSYAWPIVALLIPFTIVGTLCQVINEAKKDQFVELLRKKYMAGDCKDCDGRGKIRIISTRHIEDSDRSYTEISIITCERCGGLGLNPADVAWAKAKIMEEEAARKREKKGEKTKK